MKKFAFLTLILCLICPLFLCSCKDKTPNYAENIVQLRSDVFLGESENFKVKAHYGFTRNSLEENPVYSLTFILANIKEDSVNYTLSIEHNGKEYKQTFALSPVSGLLTASVQIVDFTLKEFSVNILYSSNTEKVVLKTALDSNCKSYTQVLSSLNQSQSQLLQSYTNEDGEFTAKIYIRALSKNSKTYYYVGFQDQKGNLKALLVDAISLEVLAIREIF